MISPNNGAFLNGFLLPKLVNIPFAFYLLINLDFLAPYTADFNN